MHISDNLFMKAIYIVYHEGMRETGFWTFFFFYLKSIWLCVSLICWMIETIRWLWVLSLNECGLFIQCFDYVDNTFTGRPMIGSVQIWLILFDLLGYVTDGAPTQWLTKSTVWMTAKNSSLIFCFLDMFWFVSRTWMSIGQKSGTSADIFQSPWVGLPFLLLQHGTPMGAL